MSTANDPNQPRPHLLPTAHPTSTAHTDGLSANLLDDLAERRADEIDMIGEEEALGMAPQPHAPTITAGMRYLHASRTVAQLINDRNRSVGLYLAVASLLWTGSAWLLGANPRAELFVPIGEIQRWCLPVTFFSLSVLALIVGLLLVRTRVGLIYEVAKMNALLGLPVGRVQRVNPLSVFFLMHLIISIAGGLTSGLFAHQMMYQPLGPETTMWASSAIGVALGVLLVVLYVVMVTTTTAEKKLQDGVSPSTPATPR